MAIEQLDTENADRDLTSTVTVLTDTPNVTDNLLCQLLVELGDGVKDLDGSGGDFELTITVDGNAAQPSPQKVTFGAAIRSSVWSSPFPVPSNTEVIARVKSPNAADSDVDVTASLFDVSTTNVTQISGDATAADNLEATYDTTGYSDPNAPATQAQVDNIGFGTSADSVVATSDSNTPTGTETLTFAATAALDGIYHEIAAAGTIEQRYRFNVGGGATAVAVQWKGNVTAKNDNVEVYANTGTVAAPTWQQIGAIEGKNGSDIETITFDLFAGHTMTGTNIGEVEIRFLSDGGDVATNLRTDQILCQRQITSQTVGYANGEIWVDTTNGTAGSETFVNGTADNPVLTWTDALLLNDALKLNHFHLVPGTSIQLSASSDDFEIQGRGGTVDLNGQSVSAAIFKDLDIVGNDDGSNGTATHYQGCALGDHTLGVHHLDHCHLSGDLILAEAGTYLMDFCSSGVAGTGTPTVNFGGGVGQTWFNMRHYSGGITIMNFSDSGADVMSLEGHGQLIIGASCTAAGTIAIRGHFTITDNVAGGFVLGGGTISDDARFDVEQLASGGGGAITDTFTVENPAATPAPGVDVWVSTDEEGTDVVAGTFVTDTLGVVTFSLDIVSGLWVHAQKSGINFTGYPRQFNVASGGFSLA